MTVAVIFSSTRTPGVDEEYEAMAVEMDALAAAQPGYLGHESARGADGFGITVSYWVDDQAARDWKQVAQHLQAQRLGRERWYVVLSGGGRRRDPRVRLQYEQSRAPRTQTSPVISSVGALRLGSALNQ
ncbi:MAG: antibiotic biosynthesis monooxygenase [Candidatus Nanopelagicales bacterium]